jgi:hypothetical protein
MFNYEKVIGIVMIYFGIANATHCHPTTGRLTQNLST